MRPDQSIKNPIWNTFDNLIDVWPWNIGSDPLWVWLRPQISGHKVTSSSILSFKGQGSNPDVIIFFSLQPGDQILSINKHDLRQVTKNQAENLINKEINKVSATGQGTVSPIFYDDL